MKWLFKWWMKGVSRAAREENGAEQAMHAAAMVNHFAGGLNFQLVDAENGKILKVTVPDPNSNSAHGFHPHGATKDKLYVIPDGEDVMAFITRALVEERIK